jgi:drug/metabolite transporter (DMT)-like permease
LVGFSSACFGLSVVMARIAYDEGSNPVTVITTRFIVGVVLLAVLVLATGRNFALPRRNLVASFVLGVAVCASSLAYFSAVRLIPVSLAVLIFYTFPIVVGIAAHFTEGEPLTVGKLGALALAFIGLATALRVDFVANDWHGLLLALVPALVIGSITLFAGPYVRGVSLRVVTMYMMASGAVAMSLVLAFGAHLALPGSLLGWLALIAVPLSFVCGNICYFAAFGRLRSVDIAMMMNLEPVSTIVFAIMLLGDLLSPIQYLGAALVIAAIFLMTGLRR